MPPVVVDRTSWRRSPKRIAFAVAGFVCIGLAFAGVVLPGLPTTIFLIAASWLFTKSCPWLEERLVRNRWFAPYLPYVDGCEPLPPKARRTAIAAMWGAVLLSLLATSATGRLGPVFGVGIVASAVLGTFVILRFRRTVRES